MDAKRFDQCISCLQKDYNIPQYIKFRRMVYEIFLATIKFFNLHIHSILGKCFIKFEHYCPYNPFLIGFK